MNRQRARWLLALLTTAKLGGTRGSDNACGCGGASGARLGRGCRIAIIADGLHRFGLMTIAAATTGAAFGVGFRAAAGPTTSLELGVLEQVGGQKCAVRLAEIRIAQRIGRVSERCVADAVQRAVR